MATRTTSQCICCGKRFEIRREVRRCPKCARSLAGTAAPLAKSPDPRNGGFVALADYFRRTPIKKPEKEGT